MIHTQETCTIEGEDNQQIQQLFLIKQSYNTSTGLGGGGSDYMLIRATIHTQGNLYSTR